MAETVQGIEASRQAARRLATKALHEGYRPAGLHEYQDADGKSVLWRIRCKHEDGSKWIRPMHFIGTGYALGNPEEPENGWPVYRLPELMADTGRPVWFVEGENCADALAKLKFIATTTGSASSAEGADLSPLAGREITIWPDNDDAGKKYAQDVADKLCDLGCGVAVVDIDQLGLPEHGDVVDWLAANPGAGATAVYDLPVSRVKEATGPVPEPLPSGLPPVEPFTPELLPTSLTGRCMDISERMQCAPDFAAVGAMVALGSLIGREIGIHPKRRDDWLVVPNLWGCIVGRPSVLKSPALEESTSPLRRLEAEEKEAHAEANKQHEIDTAMGEMRRDEAKKKAKTAVKKGNITEAEDLLEESMREELESPTERRYRTNDATVEKLGELLADNPRGLMMFRDELSGWLAGLDKEGREGERSFFLESFNGTGSFTYDRIGRGTVRIDACTVSVLGGTQPGKLSQYVRQAIQGGYGDDGLMQRFQMLVWPDRGSWQHVDRRPNGEARQKAFEVFKYLSEVTAEDVGAVKDEYGEIAALRFDEEAQGVFDDWYVTLQTRIQHGDMPAYLEAHLAKYASLMPSLALIIHLAEFRTGPIGRDAAERAAAWCEYLETHARRMYAPGLMGDELAALELGKRIRRGDIGPEFTPRELYRKHWAGLNTPDDANGAISVLEERGWLSVERISNGGRPKDVCIVNPVALEMKQ